MEVRGLSFSYGSHEVLKNVSFSAKNGELLSVLGANGVGKSTLFSCMLRLLKPSAGAILVDGADIASLSAKELARRIAYIPQSHNPVFNYSVFDMALMGATAQLGNLSSPKEAHYRRVDAALEQLGISHLRKRGYAQLSGGERQLTLIARALVQDAKILIMDEPSSSLDYGNRVRVMQTVRALTKQGYAVIQSTHDPDQAYLYSDKILALHEGRILAHGTPQEVIQDDIISKLYGIDVAVCHVESNAFCIPKGVLL